MQCTNLSVNETIMKRIIQKVNLGRRYLFSTPTKAIEFLNGIALILFGLVFLLNGNMLGKYRLYLDFNYVGPLWVWGIVVIIGLIQLTHMRRDNLESNMVSAITLKVSALVWFLIAVMFGADYPPLSTGIGTYFILGLVDVLAGLHLSGQNDYELLIREEYRNG